MYQLLKARDLSCKTFNLSSKTSLNIRDINLWVGCKNLKWGYQGMDMSIYGSIFINPPLSLWGKGIGYDKMQNMKLTIGSIVKIL